ncbi:hypothetical protein B0H16DRAFT_1475353 [Mycena metata]|uniref:Uncharacterized protein n=1 Tax=Mycena metata TaxID=1033252 RepID=A0AAD7HFG4_9AGAR|nr:hypothetical protein B0H16DRAFT_1475353 [Mycena metata]
MNGEVTPGLPRRGPEREAAVELMQIVDSEGYKPRAQIASCESPLAATSINSRGDWGRGDWKPPFGTRDGSWRCESAVGRQVLGICGEGRRWVPGVRGQKGRAQWARARLGGGGCGRITGAARRGDVGEGREGVRRGRDRQAVWGRIDLVEERRRCWPRFYIMRKGPVEEGGCGDLSAERRVRRGMLNGWGAAGCGGALGVVVVWDERSGCRDVPGRGPGDTVVNCICATLVRPKFRQGS